MFGFLRVKKCSLSQEESERYRAHFCATCHAMDGFGGKLSSLLTNYDMTFWLLVLSALEGSDEIGYGRCTALPWRTVPLARLSPRGLRAAAALNLALVGSKIEDDRVDGDRKLVGLAFRLLDKPLGKARDVLVELEFPLESLAELHRRQALVERDASPTLDSLCEPTSEMLGNVFVFLAGLSERPSLVDGLRSCGRALGRLLYLLDALKDYADDRKRGRFNAFLRTSSSLAAMRSSLWAALNSFQGTLARLPLESRAELVDGLLGGLRKQIQEGLRSVSSPPVAFGLIGRRLARAGFVRTQDCDCGGCAGCGDGCGSCDACNCDGCSGCDCGPCHGCDCGNCKACEGCGNVDCGGCDCGSDGCDCCCEVCDCNCFDVCCFWDENREQRRYTRLSKKAAKKGQPPPPPPPAQEEPVADDQG